MNQQGFGQQHGHQGGMGGTSYGQGHSTSGFGQHDQGGQHAGQQGGGYGSQYGFNQGGQMGGMGGQMGGGMGGSFGGQSHFGQGGMHGGQQQQGRDFQLNPHTMDKDYNLVSVLYHALQAADTCAKYSEDARREGSPEIAQFMEQVQQQNLQISQRAKELLFRQRQI